MTYCVGRAGERQTAGFDLGLRKSSICMSTAILPEAYQACLNQVAARCPMMMDGLVEKAQTSMRERERSAHATERDVLKTAVHLLARHKTMLCERFAGQLLEGIAASSKRDTQVGSSAGLRFDELELMDDAQVQENVELARLQQAALLAADLQLGELDARMSTALGLATVQPDRNPLRPHAFGQALRDVLQQTEAEPQIRIRWMHAFGAALGTGLSDLYAELNQLLKSRGIDQAAYVVTQSPDARIQVPVASKLAPSAAAASGSLTMDQLHRLLSGDLDGEHGSPTANEPAQRPRFAATVPAALEILQEMNQVDVAVQRLRETRKDEVSLGQQLGREVVRLMVANMAEDPRLLAPVRAAIARLEPALMQLAMSDPRFFSDKAHPARQLLDRMTQRSLAFASVDSPGFAAMMQPMEQCIALLLDATIEDHSPFAAALGLLDQTWAEQESAQRSTRSHAMQALLQAEQRNLQAQKIGDELARRPDALHAPAFVKEFLAGPWAQVMAQAQLNQGHGPGGSQVHSALVDDLLWSVLPELVRKNRPRLMRIIPTMLPKLRMGLQTIEYPPEETTQFFADLMVMHQQVLKPVATPVAPLKVDAAPEDTLTARERLSAQFDEAGSSRPWLAPAEARESGFMEWSPTSPGDSIGHSTQPMQYETRSMPQDARDSIASGQEDGRSSPDLSLGAWIEFAGKDQWVRAQLTWASPHGTLFMFAGADGHPYSMTRRTMDRLQADGTLRVVARQDVVSGALDAVARTAMRNSVDITL